MRLAVVGSRGFNDYQLLKVVLDKIMLDVPFDVIVSGGASGADTLAERYAKEHDIKTDIYYPDWKAHGKSAGFKRNFEIWENADYGVAFWDGESKGTAHSFEIAKKQNKRLFVYDYKIEKLYERT